MTTEQEKLSKRIEDRTLSIRSLFKTFCLDFNINAIMSPVLLKKSIEYYFTDTQVIKNNHLAINRTNDSKKFAFMVKAINITKPIRTSGDSVTFRQLHINEVFSLYCGLNHIKDQNIRNIVLGHMKNFVYLIFNQEMNYLQLALTMDLIFQKEISTMKGKDSL